MDKKEKDQPKSAIPGVDPELEKKVDEMMDVDRPDPLPKAPEPAQAPTSAPLLPSDKLPKFDEPKIEEQPQAPLQPQIIKPEIKTDEAMKDEIGIEDPATNYAVDDIVSEESNQILATEDAKAALASAPEPKKGFWARMFAWWHKPLYRRLFIAFVFGVLIALAAWPTSRYFILNSVGVRSSSTVIILDEKTRQPLKNVDVGLGGQTIKTDIEGKASFSELKLGPQDLVVNKPAYAADTKNITIGWGNNQLGDIYLKPVGSQYTIKVVDFLSGKPITKAEASSGESSAVANEKGEITLTIPNSNDTEFKAQVTASNYRTENLILPVSTKDTKELKMVPSRKAVFVSKRSGTYDVFKVDVDGENEELLLAGTGTESEDNMALVSHPTKELVALVSTRGLEKAKDGSLLSTLTLLDVGTKNAEVITNAESVQIIGWSNNKLIYIETANDVKDDDKYKNKIKSFDIETGENKELASSNFFNDVMFANGTVLYAPAEFAVNGKVGLYKINPDGTNKLTIYDKEVWSLFRLNYNTVSVSVSDDWYNFNLNDNSFAKADSAPTARKSRIYSDNSNRTKSLWVDDRDGKGVLLIYTLSDDKDKAIKSAGGLNEPVRWLDDNHAIYRITSGETADYVISLSGGEAKKISDVTNVAGLDRWYYY